MYDFYTQITRIFNTGKSRSVLLVGDVEDLFFDGASFVPIVDFISKRCIVNPSDKSQGLTQIIYEINRPVRVFGNEEELRLIWNQQYGVLPLKATTAVGKKDNPNDYDVLMRQTTENPTFALEFIRKLIDKTRDKRKNNLLVVIEGADMLLPEAQIAAMNFADRKRVAIMHDWFSDPKFTGGHDSVLLIAESRSMVNGQVARLPQLLTVEVPNPTKEHRKKFAESIGVEAKYLDQTAGLSIHAYRQILIDPEVKIEDVVGKVEEYIVSLVGDEVVEFKRPSHTLDNCIGYASLKAFLRDKFIPSVAGPPERSISGALVAGPIGCHAAGQLILCHDGSVKKVEEVTTRDLLMGMDSTPRKVLSLIRGQGRMYRIIPKKGDSFAVNEDHILTLKRTRCRSSSKKRDTLAGEVVDVKVSDYLSWSKTRKGLYKLFRVGVRFETQNLQIDPYFMGVLIGDGSFLNSPNVTSIDYEVLSETIKQSKKWGLKLGVRLQQKTKAITLSLVGKKKHANPLTDELRRLGIWGKKSKQKNIPMIYLIADRQQRLELLAGLLDTDGSYGHCFDFSSTSEQVAFDATYLSRSLGFAAYKSGPFLKHDQDGAETLCWRVSISGDLNLIPTRIPRKQAHPRRQKKSVMMTGLSIMEVGKDDFYGFEVDGDGRYLLGDFTVTHNSGKTFMIEAVASMLGIPVMVLKNFRSQWFGQTDVLVERIKRAVYAIVRDSGGDNGSKILIFVDEADTAFGGVSKDAHETERRATGKIQAMMSDPALRGKAIWLLMTARPHLLSADMRRPGRAGELIIPILDPDDHGEGDTGEFIKWAFGDLEINPNQPVYSRVFDAVRHFSSADFQSLKSRIGAEGCKTVEDVLALIEDTIPPDIGKVRKYQKLQALLNCTRKSLLPGAWKYDPDAWRKQVRELEVEGVS